MPYSFNGCGTRYYGERDRAEDGSYITTEWITFVFFPLFPIASYRVRPVGKGTNLIIHSSQSYQTLRVPLCWEQIKNVYLVVGPILLVILYFAAPDIKQWWNEGTGKFQSTLQPEPSPVHSADLPLDSKDAVVACGKVLKLNQGAFTKLELIPRLAQVVSASGFTDEDLKEMGSTKDLQEQAFSAYSFAYLMWDQPAEGSRVEFDKMVIKAAHSADGNNLSPDDNARLDAYLVRFKGMMLKAFDLGKHDARISPCPF